MNQPPATAQWSLRHELTRVLVLTALLPALLVGVALLWSQWHDARESVLVRQDSNARLTANAIDDFLEGQRAGLQLLAEQSSGELDEDELGRLLALYPAMLRALQVGPDGSILRGVDARGRPVPAGPINAEQEEWFRVPRDRNEPFISDVFRSRLHQAEVLVSVSAPLRAAGNFNGVLQATIPVDSFARLNSDSLSRRNFELLLLDRHNRVVFAGPGLRWHLLDDTGAVGARFRARALPASQATRIWREENLLRQGGGDADAVLMRNGWVVVLVAAENGLWTEMVPRLWLLLALLVATTIGVLVALWRQKRLLKLSIGYMLASLRGYALGGRLDPAQLSRMPEELHPLADGIGELERRMNAAYDELRQVLAEREQVIAERTESLRQAVSELALLSRTDALTGSLNYRGFLETGEREWAEATARGRPLSVLALDIDHFKGYNDLYGHAQGDGALRRFAGAVRSALQNADDVLARPGGEEFTVFLPGSTHEQALRVAARICQRVRDADIVHAASPRGRMTVSIGVASLQPGDADVEDMLKRADDALYRAKQAGRDQAL